MISFLSTLFLAQLCVDTGVGQPICGVRGLKCEGQLSCTGSRGIITLSVDAGSGSGASVPAACSSGQALTSNGTALVCTSTITAERLAADPTDCSADFFAKGIDQFGSTSCGQVSFTQVQGSAADSQIPNGITIDLAAAASALAANPADCSPNQYATTIAASGALTCAQVTTAQLSGTITNAQLASSYSGVGACGANTWSSTLNANAAPTCTQPAFSNLSGSATDSQIPDGITVTLAATATALAADPADCSAGQFATGIAASGALTCATGGTTTKLITSNYGNSTVTPSTILSFTAVANTEYGFECALTVSGTATSLPRFNITGPTSTNVAFITRRFTTTALETLLVLQAFSAAAQTAACTSACTTTQLPVFIHGSFIVGGSGGSVLVQGASSTAGQTVVVYRGSFCRFY